MCGISGFLDTTSGAQRDVLRQMNDAIRHRGPDDEGYALITPGGQIACAGPDTDPTLQLPPLESVAAPGAFLGFGHRRLSILDLSPAGHQPMSLSEQGLCLTYNGEIYNYLELRRELEGLGHTFSTACDTEVLLHAYAQWGEDCLARFNGMWSFALWDSRERKLFCARDRLGAKPFHYVRRGNRFLFGSELKQLCRDTSIPRRFDESYLAANLMYRICDYNGQTLLADMHALRPGHKLVLRLSADCGAITSLEETPYWRLETRWDETVSAGEWRERVAAEFSRSCAWRLRSDAPVAALLSGGLDSSCLVTELCGLLPDPAALQTFTTSYPGRADCDEWDFARMVNDACGCRGHQILPDPRDGIERRFESLIDHVEGPAGLALLGPKLLLDDVAGRGIKVVLNGQCGDETMFGYERYYAYYFADLLRRGQAAAMLREARLAARHSRFSAVSLAKMTAYFNFSAVRDGRQLRRAGAFVQPELLSQRRTEELRALLYPKTLSQLQYNELTATQLPHIVRFDDRLYMSASLESRIPFMDYQFVELSCRIPPAMKIQNGYTKNIMREIFDARMPKAVTWRTNKMGFGAPTDQWAAAFSRDYLNDRIETAKTAPYFQKDALRRMLGSPAVNQDLFAFLAIEQFARQFHVAC